ncbi:zinc finger protein 846-like [Plodia interpunctella]|uniref:zinc finger protein 846-like n=1 Tax=Plodia interpunctella TaxID=58824 RepID=UPI0023675C54|nr:zinc finger protein 846-like [Plodia interpunctella]
MQKREDNKLINLFIMSSLICFVCHNHVHMDTNDEFRDKYRELIGVNLTLDSYLCGMCCHILDKFWYFKSVCMKRSYKYPVLLNERGTLYLQKTDIETFTMCHEDDCKKYDNSINFVDENECLINDYDIFNDHDHLTDKNVDYINTLPDDIALVSDDANERNRLNNDNQIDEQKMHDGNNTDYKLHAQSPQNYDIHHLDQEDNTQCRYGDDSMNELNDVSNTNDLENYINDERVKNGKVKSKKKKKEFDKVLLSLEEQKAELERNRKEKKYIEAEFKCYNCALGFLFKDTYQAHMMRHEESNGEHRCDVCTLRFACPAVLRSHASQHSVRHVCRRCAVTLRPRARATHRAHCYGEGNTAACHKCARLFKNSSGLQQHLKRFHRSSSKSYRCGVCGNNYSSQPAVRTHMLTHIQRKFTCEFCPAIFSSPYTLTQHKKSHDPSAAVDTHHCVPCNKSFKNKKSLLTHKRNAKYHQEESFECAVCARACANQRSLNHHMESIHSATRSYACSRCSARYNTDKALKRHMRGHDGLVEKKLAICHLCGRSFKSNNKLNRHIREVCEKEKLEEQLSSYYAHDDI